MTRCRRRAMPLACCRYGEEIRCLTRSSPCRLTGRCSFRRTNDMEGVGLRLVDLLWHPVGLNPDKVALRIDGKTRTYRALAARVEQLADHLGRAIGPGDRVGLWFHNCASWVESFL